MGIYRQGNIYWCNKCINGIQYRKSAETTLKMQAKAFYDDWVYELKEHVKNGKPIIKQEPIKQITFKELAIQYLEWVNGRQKSYNVKKYIVPILVKKFDNKKLSDFNGILIENLQSDYLKNDFKPAYINKIITILKHMFSKALDWEYINDDILIKIRKAKAIKGEIKRLRYLSDGEIETLISNCDSYLKPIVIAALNTGMRKSEILYLTWDRVDLKNRIILLDITKNGERREIPINDTLFNVLSGMIRNIKVDYVFYNPATLKPYYTIQSAFERALKKAHIIDFHFHDLRHTFASRLVMNGVDLTTIKELLGHKDIKMTLRYSHLSQAHIKQAISTLDKNYHNFIIAGENDKINNS
ncbi:MAG: tyrosine-type recombinase/integrase [bacterium]